MQAVILAAGRGTRLHPITANRTKAMAPVIGKPIVERVMEPLAMLGIQSFIIVISPEDDEIKDHFANLRTLDADIKLVPQPDPLGMGHALQQAAPLILKDFILSSCDNLVDPVEISHLLKFWDSKKPDALLTTIQIDPREVVRMGVLGVENDKVIQIVEKPPLGRAPSNVGSIPLYIFSTSILNDLKKIPRSPRGEYELQDAIQMLIDRGGDVRAFQLTGRSDLTKPEDLLKINRQYLTKGHHQKGVSQENIGKNNIFIPPFFIEDDVVVGSNCVIGPDVYIEHGCTLGDNVRLRDVVVLRNRSILSNTSVTNQLLW